jgi:hypothetical protein
VSLLSALGSTSKHSTTEIPGRSLLKSELFRLFPNSAFDDAAVQARVPLEAVHVNLTVLILCGIARTSHSSRTLEEGRGGHQ